MASTDSHISINTMLKQMETRVKKEELIRLSKRAAYILRHSPYPNSDGRMATEALAEVLGCSIEAVKQIVAEDEKGRYEFSSDQTMVRAVYGHSIAVDAGQTACMPPDTLYHGTATKYLDRIMAEGLKPRSRQFVHLSDRAEIALAVGSRHGNAVVLEVDAAAACKGGTTFYKTASGVWQADAVPAAYLHVPPEKTDGDE